LSEKSLKVEWSETNRGEMWGRGVHWGKVYGAGCEFQVKRNAGLFCILLPKLLVARSLDREGAQSSIWRVEDVKLKGG